MQHPKIQKGLSYIEIMIIVIILGVVAAVAMPNFSSTNLAKLDNAASEVADAIQFARAESIRTKIPYGIIADATTNRIRVYRLLGLTATYDVYHPIDKQLYDIQLTTDAFVSGVVLDSASFSFTGSSATTYVHFSDVGTPEYTTSGGTDYMLTSGTIILSYRGQQRTLSIAPMTGRVTVQ